MATAKLLESVNEKTNGGKDIIEHGMPYTVSVTIQGSCDMLFHAWNSEAVEEKGRSAKGSKAKKEDNVESFVYRCEDNTIGIPGEYLRGSIINAAKFRQDPRSPRKSAADLYKAGISSLTILASLGKEKWDYLDKRRAVIQRQGINRTRPAMKAGWEATFDLAVVLPEYVDAVSLREVIEQAGRLVGIADFRPTFGRFGIVKFVVR